MLPTFLAAAGNPDIRQQLLVGTSANGRDYKVHLDGYDLGPAFKGAGEWPRKEFLYWTDDGNVAAVRYGDWKASFLVQNAEGLKVWQQPFEQLRAPLLTNLRMDPFERAQHDDAMGYQRWYLEHMFMIAPAAGYVGNWMQSFRDFPPRQKPGSFNLDRVMEAVTVTPGGG
jgi:arylsulfatase